MQAGGRAELLLVHSLVPSPPRPAGSELAVINISLPPPHPQVVLLFRLFVGINRAPTRIS